MSPDIINSDAVGTMLGWVQTLLTNLGAWPVLGAAISVVLILSTAKFVFGLFSR